MEVVAELEVSILYIVKDQSYRGRCILALKEHKTEVFQLSVGEVEAFGRDMAKASKAIHEAFKPDKINYAAFGDTYPHVHFHLVPKYHEGKSWGGPFELAPNPDKFLSAQEIAEPIARLREKL
jgi:diadenosine tetraphosphate (Ap4A) HIT family hydrolase